MRAARLRFHGPAARRRAISTMLAFAIRRLLEALVVMLAVALIAFALFRFVGDPVNQMVGQDATRRGSRDDPARAGPRRPDPRAVRPLRRQCGAVRFRHFLSGEAARGAADRRAAAGHLELALAAALFAIALGIPMGVYTGIHRDSWLSKVFLTVSLIGISLPTFLIGILLIYVFCRVAQRAAVVRPRRGGAARASGAPGCSPPRASRR